MTNPNATPEHTGGTLTPKQAAFVREYIIDLNATQAAIRAGYSAATATEQGSRLLTYAQVAAAIQAALDARAQATGITAERVLREIACMALYDPADLVITPVMCPADILKLPEATRRAIIGWSWDKAGNFVLKLSPKTPALDQLGRHLKMFTDKIEHSGNVTALTDAELDAKIAALQAAGGGNAG